jgi:hypothetical protein
MALQRLIPNPRTNCPDSVAHTIKSFSNLDSFASAALNNCILIFAFLFVL